jgi:hypothetical protein
MPFGLVDDKLHSSVKWRMASKGGRALWSTALSWCMDQLTDGRVPRGMLRALDGTPGDARSLVSVGLWETDGDGWVFHDWLDYQPDAATIRATRAAKSSGGKEGNHRRWHAGRGVVVEDCEFCSSVDRSEDRRGNRIGTESDPNPPRPTPSPRPISNSPKKAAAPFVTRGNEPADVEPEHSVNALLASAGLAQHEHRGFLVDLKGNGARNTSSLINALHRDGKLAGRIAEWRTERDLASEAASRPRPGAKPTTNDKVREGYDIADRFAELEGGLPDNVRQLPMIEGA